MNQNIDVTMVAQPVGSDVQTLEVPRVGSLWSNIVGLQYFDSAFSGAFQPTSLSDQATLLTSTFSRDDTITRLINGVSVPYTRYESTAGVRGVIILKFKV